MKPSSPIVPGHDLPETVYAKHQPEYQPLPVYLQRDGAVLSRWHCTWRERLRILITGDVYLWQLTFNGPLQPVSVEAEKPLVKRTAFRDCLRWAFNLNLKFGWAKTPRGFLCWDFKSSEPPRIHWSRDATPTSEGGCKVIL